MKIAIASDHAGPIQKREIIDWLESEGHSVNNFGTDKEESVDYPDFASKAALAVGSGESDIGIIICGSGIGVSITANKIKNVRAAVCYNNEIAKLSRQHNNANIICYGARFFDINDAKEMIKIFIETEFEGGRHLRRVDKIHDLTGC